jgi:hypothetical protein
LENRFIVPNPRGIVFLPLFSSNIDVFILLPGGTSLKQSRLTNQIHQPVVAKLPKSQLAVVHKRENQNMDREGRLCKWHPLGCRINADDDVLGACVVPCYFSRIPTLVCLKQYFNMWNL